MNTNGTYLQKTVAFVLSVIFFLFAYKMGHAQNSSLLSPTRLVFDQSGESLKEFTVSNPTNDTVSYLLSLVEMRMKEDGKLEAVKQADDLLVASKYLFIYPNRMVLKPHETRSVKVRLNTGGNLAPGEYRSHIYLRQETANGRTVRAMRGITMPVIVREGTLEATATISNIRLRKVQDTPILQLTVNRSGNMSLYGDINVSYMDSTGKTVSVGSIKGTAVYTPTRYRVFNIKLRQEPGVNYNSGRLMVEYAGSGLSTTIPSPASPLAKQEYVLQ